MFHSLRIENDVEIPMRDELALSANLFRPDADGCFPAIMTLGPYPKDIHFKDSGPRASGPMRLARALRSRTVPA